MWHNFLSFPLTESIDELAEHKRLCLVNVGNTTAKAFLISQIVQKTADISNIFWASSEERADQLFAVASLFWPHAVHLVPSELTPQKFYEIYNSLDVTEPQLFLFENIAEIQSQTLPTTEILEAKKIAIKKGDKISVYPFFERLEAIGYKPATDNALENGEFVRRGENIFLFPANASRPVRLTLDGKMVESMHEAKSAECQEYETEIRAVEIFPAAFSTTEGTCLIDIIGQSKNSLFLDDDLDESTITFPKKNKGFYLRFTTFPRDDERFFHLNFFSVLPFYTIPDFVTDIKERLRRDFSILILTKRKGDLEHIFRENHIRFSEKIEKQVSTVVIRAMDEEEFLPHSFQNSDQKILLLTDREIFQFRRSSRQKKSTTALSLEMMTSLKPGDYVVHVDHGIARFEGIVRREAQKGEVREYLKLQYAGSDRLFVPVESAEKISRYVGDEHPRLTRFGGVEWKTTQRKIKAETEKIAKDLLKLYAARELAKGKKFSPDDPMMKDFCENFAYVLTPGQAAAWDDVRMDMERSKPMDRLVCGDVGFGKTEIAMRAAFKAFRSGFQCAFLSPITILAEQHYQSFIKRVKGKNYDIRVELLSRFQTPAQQKAILEDTKKGLVHVLIGTHRLLSDDLEFKNLGLLVIDEEQRFGVEQKEKLKKLRVGVDLLTLTATPIPRTLNMSLNKLKDISTITTPPPGRLPVVTEVRKYNPDLIRDRIKCEIERGGQVYFLHNKVQTIESQKQYLESLVPEAKFIVAHGQLSPHELENRIRHFKDREADVLIASTIIENGIDLANANTLFVNGAENFGLSQLYQLRGRVGRSRTQAYAYFLYHGQKLEIDAKKRLRAIVEASELGAGFQIAMRDLEIRGAGEVLGIRQAGAIKDAGVQHFVRMLHKTVDEMKTGEVSQVLDEEENISVEIPVSAFIPTHYIPNSQEKIQIYQELSAVETLDQLSEIKEDFRSDYGPFPAEVENLFKVIRLKILLRASHMAGIRVQKASHKSSEIVMRMGKNFHPSQLLSLLKDSPWKWTVTANALKISFESMPISWYDDVSRDIERMEVKGEQKISEEKIRGNVLVGNLSF